MSESDSVMTVSSKEGAIYLHFGEGDYLRLSRVAAPRVVMRIVEELRDSF